MIEVDPPITNLLKLIKNVTFSIKFRKLHLNLKTDKGCLTMIDFDKSTVLKVSPQATLKIFVDPNFYIESGGGSNMTNFSAPRPRKYNDSTVID